MEGGGAMKEEIPYASGGRNPNWELCCDTCEHFVLDTQYRGHGWCGARTPTPSVSVNGGCELHSKATKP